MSDDNVLPLLPYGGRSQRQNSGHSGSDTSRERAEWDDADGTTSARQSQVLRLLELRATRGATWSEVATELGLHHGAASGALSNLHKTGRILRLAEKRNRSKVYVLPRFLTQRQTEPYGTTNSTATLVESCFHFLDEMPEYLVESLSHDMQRERLRLMSIIRARRE